MPKLILRPGTPQAQEFELKPGKNFVGRGFANDFKLEDGSVSSSHALFEMNGSVVTITDLGSTNGTRVNGLPATGSPLQNGHILKLGAVELLYVAEAAATRPAPTPPPPTAAAAQIATEFIIRDPSRVGVAPPPPPAPVGGELRIPGVTPPAPPPPPTPITTAPTPIAQAGGLSIPSVAPIAPPPPPLVPAAAAPAPIPQPSRMSIPAATPSAPPPPPPAPVTSAPAPIPQPSATSIPAAAPSAPLPPPPPITATLAAEAPLPGGVSRFSNIAPAPPIAAAPSAPATTVVKEPISAKTVCKFHKNDPGQWQCPKCNDVFCLLCVEAKPTPSGVAYFCKACGTQCVAVKVKQTKKIEKMPQGGLETGVLLRTIGFGLSGAIVGAGIWTGVAALTGFDQPVAFAPLIGIACGFGVKTASQDRPGRFFSIAAAAATLLGTVAGKIAAVMVTHHGFVFTAVPLSLGILGLVVGMFAAWKVGGGDF